MRGSSAGSSYRSNSPASRRSRAVPRVAPTTLPRVDMSRGKPPPEVLDALRGLENTTVLRHDEIDLRNYGEPLGLPSARRLGADLLDAPPEATLVGPNSSMALLHQVVTAAYFVGWAGQKPWRERGARPKVLFPVPGYDRHATLLQTFGLEMVPVEMQDDGMAEDGFDHLADDPDVVGIVCVPRHSNPGGEIWSRDKLGRIFDICERRGDLTFLCDNAYAVFDLYPDEAPEPFSIYTAAEEHGALDSLALFSTTSKLGYAGSGLSFLACSQTALKAFEPVLTGMTLGADKLAQGRHLEFFGDSEGIRARFEKDVAPWMRKRFDIVAAHLGPLGDEEGFSVSEPSGGYFHSLWVPKGRATYTVELASKKGVTLTEPGAAFPYGKDPDDSHLRIASTSTDTLGELSLALEIVVEAARDAAS